MKCSRTVTEVDLNCVFNSNSMLCMKLGTPECVCVFRTVISSWLIVPLVKMVCSSLSLLIYFRLNSMLSDIRISDPSLLPGSICLDSFFRPFTVVWCLLLRVSSVSCRR